MTQQIKSYIDAYKDNFTKISNEELYKWRAVKQFKDHWDVDAEDFYPMLKIALSKVRNLMDAGMYFPKKMLLSNAEVAPEKVRTLFKKLFNEEESIKERIESFQSQFIALNTNNFSEKKHYQDHRAIVVYLALKFPDRYYFYKFGMFKYIAEKIDYTYQPVMGSIENVFHFKNLCDQVKHIVSQDQELLRLHNNRLTEDCYIDESLHILTQDVIYAIVQHLNAETIIQNNTTTEISVETVAVSTVNVTNNNVSFKGRITNHLQNNIKNKRIGDLGELFVIQLEREKLKKANKQKLAKKVAHHAIDQGDGLGYDVLSFDKDGNEMFIEVKSTESNKNTPFYITKNELERSKEKQDNFFIYRVYNFKEDTLKGDVLILQGDASNLCVEPVNYKVKMS